LAKKVGTTQAVISRIENGTVNIGIDFLEKIARAFNKKVEFHII
jgi:transcriptional regulator with XRE-family HTH domain